LNIGDEVLDVLGVMELLRGVERRTSLARSALISVLTVPISLQTAKALHSRISPVSRLARGSDFFESVPLRLFRI
jgi:hypothetical protein